MPRLRAIVIQMTPIVAPVPNAVPVSTETSAQSQNVAKTMSAGETKDEPYATMAGIVPAARQNAVIMPMSTNVVRIGRIVCTPLHHMRRTARILLPFENA